MADQEAIETFFRFGLVGNVAGAEVMADQEAIETFAARSKCTESLMTAGAEVMADQEAIETISMITNNRFHMEAQR